MKSLPLSVTYYNIKIRLMWKMRLPLGNFPIIALYFALNLIISIASYSFCHVLLRVVNSTKGAVPNELPYLDVIIWAAQCLVRKLPWWDIILQVLSAETIGGNLPFSRPLSQSRAAPQSFQVANQPFKPWADWALNGLVCQVLPISIGPFLSYRANRHGAYNPKYYHTDLEDCPD